MGANPGKIFFILLLLGIAGLATGRAQEPVDPRVPAGRRDYVEGNRERAIGRFREVLAERPDDHQSLLSIALFLVYEQEDYENAEPFARRAVELLPELPEASLALGGALIFLGKAAEAQVHYERLLKLYPEDPALLFAMGMASVLHREHLKGEKYFLEAIRLQPKVALYHFCAAENYVKLHRLEPAERHFRLSLQFEPDNSQALWHLARVLGWLDKDKKAETMFRRALQSAKDVQAQIDAGVAFAGFLQEHGRDEEAVEYLKKAVEIQPKHRLAWSMLAQCYGRLGMRKKRQQARNQYLELQARTDREEDAYLLDLLKRHSQRKREAGDGGESPPSPERGLVDEDRGAGTPLAARPGDRP